MAKADKNKLWKDNTLIKFCFAYKQYFKKETKYSFVFRQLGKTGRQGKSDQ